MDANQLEYFVDSITAVAAKKRIGHLEAAREVAKHTKSSLLELQPALDEIERLKTGFQKLGPSVVDPTVYGAGSWWYAGSPSDGQWAKYLARLEAKNAPGLRTLEDETAHITSLLANPHRNDEKRKGLVMGNVQAGKTRNYAGVIARAADAGYRFVIILSGIHNNLREQTQTRLDKDLFSDSWYRLTTPDHDFLGADNFELALENQEFVCAVVKKNTAPLTKLTNALRATSETQRKKIPILIIDDEADQATPNTAKAKDEISAINQRLRNLWDLVATGTYVAYTATPFANVLINPEEAGDLFPSHFITTISTGDGYFGAEEVFGVTEWINEDGSLVKPGLDMVRSITQEESDSLRPPSDAEERVAFNPKLPSSLEDAIAWFVVASAVRRARGQRDHSSMLVHTTHYKDPHRAMQMRIRDFVAELRARIQNSDVRLLRRAWECEIGKVPDFDNIVPDWCDVEPLLPAVVGDLSVIVDNGASEDRLNYEGDIPKTVIAVGGGTLSRGLTLEGLVVSYFTRTSHSYDTLLQMGRWFGYRPGYEDLPRIWVAPGLAEDYAFLAMVERDLRDEIRSVQDGEFTPYEVGVKVRVHPGRLAITAANKMASARSVQVGFNGVLRQVYVLDGSEPAIAQHNIDSVNRLLDGKSAHQPPWFRGPEGSRYLAQGIEGSSVATFLRTFKAHHTHTWLTDVGASSNLSDWIERYAWGPVWNVALMGNSVRNRERTMQIGGQFVRTLNRNPKTGSSVDRIDLGAVVSPKDRIADINPATFAGESTATDADRRRIRRLVSPGTGLILIYPIAGDTPAPGGGDRIAMPVQHDQVAFAIVCPNVESGSGADDTFVSVRTNWEVPNYADEDEELELFERDEA